MLRHVKGIHEHDEEKKDSIGTSRDNKYDSWVEKYTGWNQY